MKNMVALITLLLAIGLLAGCTTIVEVPAPKRFDCSVPVDDKWKCSPLEGTGRDFNCEYINEN